MRVSILSLLVALASCGPKDNSAETDRSSSALTQAQSDVRDQGKGVTTRENDIEREKRDLIERQQALADHEKALAAEREQLGSARTTLVQARAAYSTAVTSRLAKLDAGLASLATKTDAASKDAAVGLRARRDQLSAKVTTMTATPDQNWAAYTKDVDTTFDAIERDLHDATD